MLREDRAEGMYRLGISVELAEVIENFTLAQVVKLSATPVLLCRLRFDDHAVLSALVDKRTSALERMAAIHQAIVLAGEPVEGMA
jgi:flagellar transcriptional activator FlhD